MSGAPTDLTIAQAAAALAAGDLSSVELTQASIAAMESGRDLNAFITETPAIAVERAQASDARRAKGEAAGPMDGIPIAVKDLFCTEGVLTTAASHILDGFVPPYESTVTAKLRRAGAVMIGKTNLDEFAMGSANVTSYYGPVKNPWRAADGKDRVPGGSSGGSAAAAHLCRRHRHRHGRLDPPARRLLWYRRHEADLWPLFALGRGRLLLQPRSAGADDADRQGLSDHAWRHGRTRPEGFHLGPRRHAGFRRRHDRRYSRSQGRHPRRIPH